MSASDVRPLRPSKLGLRDLAGCGGCAAKAPPELVEALTGLLPGAGDRDVLVGLDPSDDAAVYRLDDDRALVATVDFFPPLVDDPSDYGRIAAANAVSDVYAMGADVAFALTICGFPRAVAAADIAAVNAAAAEVVRECGGYCLGGHSIRCSEPVFGLCVLGFVHPDRVWRKAGARAGDVLMLSKALGTGVLLSECKSAGLAAATACMRRTNRDAAAALKECRRQPSAVTDVTGYGLLGHAAEVAERSATALVIVAERVPLLSGALDAAANGARTSNDVVLASRFSPRLPDGLDPALARLLADPQTSGGLLAAVAPQDVSRLAERGFVAVGDVADAPAGQVVVR